MLAESSAADAVRAVARLQQGQVAIDMIQWLGPVDLSGDLHTDSDSPCQRIGC